MSSQISWRLRRFFCVIALGLCGFFLDGAETSLSSLAEGRWPSPHPRAISSFNDWGFHVHSLSSERRRQQQANEDWWSGNAPLLAKLIARTDLPPGVPPNLVVLFDDAALKREAPAELLVAIMGRIAAAPMVDQIIPGPVRRPYTDVEMVEYAVTRLPASAHTDKRLAPAFAKLRADGRLSERALRVIDQSAASVTPAAEDPAKRDERLLAALGRSPDTWTDADQESVRSHEPSAPARAKALTLAVSAALAFDEQSSPAAAFLPLLVLQQVDLYADHLQLADLERMSAAMPKVHHRTRALMAWLSLLHADAGAVRTALRHGLVAQTMMRILPDRDQAAKLMAGPRPLQSELERLFELLPFALIDVPVFAGRETSTLDQIIQRLPRSSNVQWMLESQALVSVRWRSASDPAAALVALTWLGVKDAKEFPLVLAYGDYADLFVAPSLQGLKREIPPSMIQSIGDPGVKARMAAYFPNAAAARTIVTETVRGTSLPAQASLVAGLDLLDALPADLVGDRPGLVALLSGMGHSQAAYATTLGPSACRLRLKLGDDPAAVAREITARITDAPRWDAWHDALIAADPAHERLSTLRKAIVASGEPASGFLVWLLDLRCGRDPGAFPVQAYHDLFRRDDFSQVMLWMARAGVRAKPFLNDLRDPLILRGCHLGDRRNADWRRFDLRDPIAPARALAAIDRLDWCARDGAKK